MNFNKTFLPLLLAAMLATAPACAFDSSDPFGVNGAQADKPAKAQREKNDGHALEYTIKAWGAGFAAGTVNTALLGAGAMAPLVSAPTIALIGANLYENQTAKITAFYSGSVLRGKIRDIEHEPTPTNFGGYGLSSIRVVPSDKFGFDLNTFPSNLSKRFDVAHLTIEMGTQPIFAVLPKSSGLEEGDIVDIKIPVGVFAFNAKVSDNLHFDFNKHMPRVVNVYCKHDNPVCQNDYESSLGVMSRPNIAEFPPSQYLIDPAIIAADHAKMRKEAEESKAAANSGGF
ncbi:MAG: hypothetical protein KKG92_14685, partial [Gammaproteobacteria bacterium]|nr:hypothetical protein [Gammaproteobacteria bacterium]